MIVLLYQFDIDLFFSCVCATLRSKRRPRKCQSVSLLCRTWRAALSSSKSYWNSTLSLELHYSPATTWRYVTTWKYTLRFGSPVTVVSLFALQLQNCFLSSFCAALGVFEHNIWLQGLEFTFGIKWNALSWFESYLSNRFQFVHINMESSSHAEVIHGVPQGSVLGLRRFTLHMLP